MDSTCRRTSLLQISRASATIKATAHTASEIRGSSYCLRGDRSFDQFPLLLHHHLGSLVLTLQFENVHSPWLKCDFLLSQSIRAVYLHRSETTPTAYAYKLPGTTVIGQSLDDAERAVNLFRHHHPNHRVCEC